MSTNQVQFLDRLALLCIDEPALLEAVKEQVSQLGFGIHTALFTEELTVKTRARSYGLIVIAEGFAGASVETNPALIETACLPLDRRRETFVILIGPGMVSRSEMQAFMHSVDLTLRKDDVGALKTIVEAEMALKANAYGPFKNAMASR